MQTNVFTALVSSILSSSLFMTVKTVMLVANKVNLNGVRCTSAFIDEIVSNQDKYVSLPLVVDTQTLERGRYDKLSHNYDSVTDTFDTDIIGSFYKFEKDILDDGTVALIGYARISKRNKETCKSVAKLFAEGRLKFSFLIACGTSKKLEDGTVQIDAALNNHLLSLCIVSCPAVPEACALQLVANVVVVDREEAIEMDNEIKTEEVIAQEVIIEETAPIIPPEVKEEKVEETAACGKKKCSDEEEASCKKKCSEDDETAACGKKKCSEEEETAAKKKDDYNESKDPFWKEKCAEEEETAAKKKDDYNESKDPFWKLKCAEEEETAAKKKDDYNESKDPFWKQKCAEIDSIKEALASIMKENEALKAEIAEIKTAAAERLVAEQKKIEEAASAINPFMADISAPKYDLLEKADDDMSRYTLLDKA